MLIAMSNRPQIYCFKQELISSSLNGHGMVNKSADRAPPLSLRELRLTEALSYTSFQVTLAFLLIFPF